VTGVHGVGSHRLRAGRSQSGAVLAVAPVGRYTWREPVKRATDVALASLLLILCAPLLGLAALAVRLADGPGVLFRQIRVGRDGQTFTVLKLRTMVCDAEQQLDGLMRHNEAAGPMFKMRDDPRVTKVGRILRGTSVDELPQLVNVLRGDMSLVGPRPALPREVAQWDDRLRERLRVRPGITGPWQVHGRFTASLDDYERLDVGYVDNWTLLGDLRLLLLTVPAVLGGDGAA
jgi:lipopolysaccharide/colanic/teichoic acid biosynthesis glycosyltransferase